MFSKQIATALKYGAVAIMLFTILLASGNWQSSPTLIGSALNEITAACRDTATQWMLVFCLVIYFVIFLILERRAQSDTPHPRFINPNLWLVGLVLLALLPYALAYGTATHSIQILVLMTGIFLGKAFTTWARWRSDKIERRAAFISRSLVCLLATAAMWQPEKAIVFQYHGIPRWIGIWDNPNLYGLLVGVGAVLSISFLVLNFRKGGWWLIPMFVATGLCGFGLIKSYSRGAWLAVFTGLIYLTIQIVKSSRFSGWFRRNGLSLTLLVASLSLLIFWQFRFSEQRPAQRVFSITNANDFSWRNRVTAWEGAAWMMIDRPWTGFGWGQAETDYGKKYCPPRLNESAAIEMNDYLMIGISAGVPTLFCFVAYLVFSFRRKPTSLSSILYPPFSIFTTARAGAIVLLVGFCFDGGLFKLPVATVFWILMELARLELFTPLPVSPVKEATANDARNNLAIVSKLGTWENCLRWWAGILAVAAAAQTTVYLGTPFLPVSEGTLAIARKCLVQQKAAEDFEFLSTNAIWRGIKLKVLLEHVRLANYNHQLINWKLDDNLYQDFVLSPVITGNLNEQLDWRRPLWEEFYLRIRHESSPEDAAKIVLKHLHERVIIATLPNPPHDVPAIWLKQTTDEVGFEIIYVAALRSVGVPALLDKNNNAEFWDGNKWQTASVVN